MCKEELDTLLSGNEHRCKILHTLTKAPDDWTGLRGRITGKLVRENYTRTEGALVLICGPEAMEKTMHKALLDDGWSDDQLMFF